MPKGISEQFKVVDRRTGEEVRGLFVIDPVRDPNARAALLGYARAAEESNWKLATDLRALVTKLESVAQDRELLISGSVEIPEWLIQQSRDREDNESE